MARTTSDPEDGAPHAPPIKTAAELIASDLEARGRERRAARETPLMSAVFRLFAETSGPVPVRELERRLPDWSGDRLREGLRKLDAGDLLILEDDAVVLAYPFTAAPSAFAVTFPDGRRCYACCAIDALGIAPMLEQPLSIDSRCHHCGEPLRISATPERLMLDASGIVVWVGERCEGEHRVATAL